MPLPPSFNYSHTIRDNVLIQDLSDWSGELEGIDHVEGEWLERASQPHITAAVTDFSPDVLTRNSHHHLVEEWSENATQAGIKKLAFVGTPEVEPRNRQTFEIAQEFRTFTSRERAIEWARG